MEPVLKTFFQLREQTSGKTLKVSREIFEAAQQMVTEEADHDHKTYKLDHSSFKDGTKYSSGESGDIAKRSHLHAKETEAGNSSTDANVVYGVHDKKTGKTHGVSISMNKKASAAKVAKAMGHKPHQIHKDIADHHNETSYVKR